MMICGGGIAAITATARSGSYQAVRPDSLNGPLTDEVIQPP